MTETALNRAAVVMPHLHIPNGMYDEFDRQVETLLRKGYPQLVGWDPGELVDRLAPLRERLSDLPPAPDEATPGRVPFVIVLDAMARADLAMPLVERNRQSGFSIMPAEDLERFKPIEGVTLPGGFAYLMLDVDTGTTTLNVAPNEALETLQLHQRSPLTIAEGVALITHFPDALQKNRCFSLLGSRCGDRRVTALWISQGRPKLGWCWAGNPHTWLGSASCAGRMGA